MLPDPRVEALLAEPTAVMLSRADFAATVRELDALRVAHRINLVESGDVSIDELRIAHLERLLASATVVEGTDSRGAASLGSVVRARKDGGGVTEYTLVGRRGLQSPPTHVTTASPVGAALLGARAGDAVTALLPSGRSLRLEILEVRPGPGLEAVKAR